MPRKLKVYGFQSFRTQCVPAPNGSLQTREVVAAHSRVEVGHLSGLSVSYLRDFCCETGNQDEVKIALSKPGKIFWHPLGQWGTKTWFEAESL